MHQLARAALAALCLASACGGAPFPDAGEQADATVPSGAPHALPFGSPSLDSEAAARAHLTYYGGPVLSNARVVAVLWGDVDPAVRDRIGGFYQAITAGPYFGWLSEYDTPGQKIGKGLLAGVVAIAPRAARKTWTDAQIEKELAAQLKAGKLPAADLDTVYMIHFPPGVRVIMGGGGSCESGGFCGYHSAFKRGGTRIAYAVLPDMGPGSGCDTGCGAGASTFDLVTSVASHELVEAVTDPEVGLAHGLAAPLAWYDAKGGEIGDICNGKSGKLKTRGAAYTVQKQWSNAARACVLGRGRAGAGARPDDLSADGG